MIGVEGTDEYLPSTFDYFLSSGIVSAENLYLDTYTTSILQSSATLQIAPKVIDLERTGCSYGMFYNCTALIKAPELPSTKLSEYCYEGMFVRCISLTEAPKLPATELADSCYARMFEDCTSLVNAPELPATELADRCYTRMFSGCTSLTKAPQLPATTLASSCYSFMFYGCKSIIEAPKLSAMTLTSGCYSSMFTNCSSLKSAPELPATELADDCYSAMFAGCTNLNHIKMLAKNIQATGCLSGWVQQITTTGTFVKTKGVEIPVGNSGIPEGWTVEEYVSPEDQLKELQVSVDSNTEEIDILKNRIISTTYSELKDAITNSTLTTGQYYRITDYVTTCNGTSAKVTDASTIDPENPVDGQSRSAGH